MTSVKKRELSPTLGPIVLMHCKCSVWPIAIYGARVGRCGECGVAPRAIPKWEDS